VILALVKPEVFTRNMSRELVFAHGNKSQYYYYLLTKTQATAKLICYKKVQLLKDARSL
jgi:hypothetical protein